VKRAENKESLVSCLMYLVVLAALVNTSARVTAKNS